MVKLILTIIYLLAGMMPIHAQQYSFYGVLLLHGKKENAISYRLDFTEKNGILTGTSTTDLTGKHETKNVISGTYDQKSKTISFVEKEIIYTKSPLSKDIFCFVRHSSKIRLASKSARLEGKFQGFYKANQRCIDGTLSLIGTPTVEKLLRLAEKKIEKSKELDPETKKQYNPQLLFDSIQTQQLTTGESLTIFVGSETVTLSIWDKNKEDGDIITLKHNEKPILSHFAVRNKVQHVTVSLEAGENVFTIEAINEGSMVPNTAMIVLEGDRKIEFQSNLKQGEKAMVRIVRKEKEG
jgi:hypothetical protein